MIKNLTNKNGNVLLIVIGIVGLLSLLVVGGAQVAKSIQKDRLYNKEKYAAEMVANTFAATLQDQRFCSSFFSGGFAGTSAPGAKGVDYPFAAGSFSGPGGSSSVIQKRINDLVVANQKQFKYQVDSIHLSNEQLISAAAAGQAEDQKTFDVSFNVSSTLTPAQQNRNSILGKLVVGTDKKVNDVIQEASRLTLTLGEKTGKCFLQKGTNSTTTFNLKQAACTALGGELVSTATGSPFSMGASSAAGALTGTSVCKLQAVNNGSIKTVATKTNFNFMDSLCQMELNLLMKEMPRAKYDRINRNNSWTKFCQQPQWSGCQEGVSSAQDPDGVGGTTYTVGDQLILGSVPGSHPAPSGTQYFSSPYRNKAKFASSDYIQPGVTSSMDNKANRLMGTPPGYIGTTGINTSINLTKSMSSGTYAAVNVLAGPLGLWTAQFFKGGDIGTSSALIGINILAMSAFGGPIGLAIGTLAVALLPKCNQARVNVIKTCRNGKMEWDAFSVDTQKRVKVFKCKWQTGPEYPLYDDATIVGMSPTTPLAPMSLPPQIPLSAQVAAMIAEINSLSSLADLIDSGVTSRDHESAPPTDPDEIAALATINAAIKAKETALVADYNAQVDATIAAFIAAQAAPLYDPDTGLLTPNPILPGLAAQLLLYSSNGQKYVTEGRLYDGTPSATSPYYYRIDLYNQVSSRVTQITTLVGASGLAIN